LRYEDLDLGYLASGRHFHLSTFFLQSGLRDDAAMREVGLTTSLDTNDDPEDLWDGPITETLKYLDILMPNEREPASWKMNLVLRMQSASLLRWFHC
jgi:sugar/nucleoside kinase (ribokinase family)